MCRKINKRKKEERKKAQVSARGEDARQGGLPRSECCQGEARHLRGGGPSVGSSTVSEENLSTLK